MKHTSEIIVLAGYRIIGLIAREIIGSGIRIALAGELKSIKMLVDPVNIDPMADMDLLEILEEHDIKLAFEASVHIDSEVMPQYSLLLLIDDDEIYMNDEVEKLASALFWRFIFWRSHHRRRDRYVNFQKLLKSAQRLLYEWCKVMISGETTMLNKGYRCNYSTGRLRALVADQQEYHLDMVVELINYLKELETKTSSFDKK